MTETYLCNMEIINIENDFFNIKVFHKNINTLIAFSPYKKELIYKESNKLTEILSKNEYQLRKILHNKQTNTFYIGFKLNFILRDNKTVIDFNDTSKLVILDKTQGTKYCYTKEKYITESYIIYTDGSYSEKHKRGAYVAVIKKPNGLYDITFDLSKEKKSSLIELEAVIEGVKKIKDITKLRIVTDSRYVIKGLTEWSENWKINNWHTAQGTKVKNIEYWQKFDKLTDGKYIEFEWVKGHSFHFENTICDKYAKQLVKRG